MAFQVSPNTPLAEALNSAIQAKLMEVGFAQASDANALSEYIILMLGNGKGQQDIVTELSTDLLGLPEDDPTTIQFVSWLFEHAESLSSQLNNGQSEAQANGDAMDGSAPQGAANDHDADTDMMTSNDVSDLNAPTGPRSMRSGPARGGREKRLLSQMSRAMDRTGDSVLHRTRGNDRINSHARGPPTGPRGLGRGGRGMNTQRVANIQAGMNAAMGGGMNGRPNGPPGMGAMGGVPGMNGSWGMPGQPPEMDLMAMMQQQSQMMAQLQQQLLSGNNGGFGQHSRPSKSLFDRAQQPHRNNQRHRQHQPNHSNNNSRSESAANEGGADGDDVDMSSTTKREPPNPEETVCKYNLRCTNRDCKFAHQSPAAPPGAHIDISDTCSFGAACKNRKCVGRHPSPATKRAHQNEQDCKFFPNCHNPQCPFKHPDMPLCRNGAGCTTPGCKFTHVKVKCRFNPCKNPHCAYNHEEGQQGVFKDKVWTAEGEGEGEGEHISERKFVNDGQGEEEVIIPQEDNVMGQEGHGAQGITT
ncbi:hypothetical protein SODALDRAFT_283850 [Sodiomyces alkalinus F11]|uniref:Nab2-like CCCH zinc finger domain-containing protein n=1 Tax=Sodiomyces alkalinus (strain CBS 110278 / VKM F-3762 / F11) TaxID=1314773 RepID=A0A3N2PLW4_SODAK|nr:hypothetical protein SODALDRAFT_283850 [Sodiomyces alkalinus F11]ROT35469.1 hypothetical protein SODALDRAFT_283850 [Sodiomyces alkalinus F11]